MQVALLGTGLTLGLAGCAGGVSHDGDVTVGEYSTLPALIVDVSRTTYDGISDDLLTAGLGKSGLAGPAPAIADPAHPTAAELRRLAIYVNYSAVLDIHPVGGYGTLYGPNIDVNGNDTLGEGKVAGTEWIAYVDDGTGQKNVTLMVQVPNTFNPKAACIVTGTSSGSRGVYGAIGSSGEWGLKHGCAVAYNDKGTGNGLHDLQNNTVNLRDGTRTDAASAGKKSNFTAALSADDLASFNATTPNRFAVKHAHSQQNPEADWGQNTLTSIRFAFYALNQQFGPLAPDGSGRHLAALLPFNTIVIASSISNGGGAALAAAEQDLFGLIDGVAISEPNAEMGPSAASVRIVRGESTRTGMNKPIYDYFTFANLFQPCASLSSRVAGAPGLALLPQSLAANRCASLAAKGLLTSTTRADQAEESLDKLLAYGWEPESNPLTPSHWVLASPAIAMTYSNTYGRFSVKDNLCGFSFGAVDSAGHPTAAAATPIAQIFGTGNGVPPESVVTIINNNSVGGPVKDILSTSPSTNAQDLNIDGALCQRALFTGNDANAQRVQKGISEVLRNGNLHGKPAIIVHAQNDALVPVNFTSRLYLGLNNQVEGSSSKLSYVEVQNANHFDTFIDNPVLPGFDSRFVPLHRYFVEALDLMYAHLTAQAALPPSQVVRTTPRGGTPGMAPAITPANVPPIALTPGSDAITVSGGVVTVPN